MIRTEHLILAGLIIVVAVGFPLWATILPLLIEHDRRPLRASGAD